MEATIEKFLEDQRPSQTIPCPAPVGSGTAGLKPEWCEAIQRRPRWTADMEDNLIAFRPKECDSCPFGSLKPRKKYKKRQRQMCKVPGWKSFPRKLSGEDIRVIRESRALSQAEFAQSVGLRLSRLVEVEAQDIILHHDMQTKIHDWLKQRHYLAERTEAHL